MLTARDHFRLLAVHPLLVQKLGAVFDAMRPVKMFVVMGARTLEQQVGEWQKGRTLPGPVVTECDGVAKKSPHQIHADGWGHAVDCAFVPTSNRPDPFDPEWPWLEFGEAAENQGLRWGGRFTHPVDLDHVELPVADGPLPDAA